jgi:exonuclease SbcC
MIRHLELHNFATHADTEIEFGDKKNVLIGQTGSGKTNLLQAIDFGFLGAEQGLNLEELIADGAETAEVILDYLDTRTSQTYRIHRTLTRDSDGKTEHVCSITNLETQETVKKPDPVRKTLESLGVDAPVFKYVVHVPQGKFADVLQEGQDRKTVLDRLFKISQLEEAYRELGLHEGPVKKIEDRKQEKLLEKARLGDKASRLQEEERLYQKLLAEQREKARRLDEVSKELERIKDIAPSIRQQLSRLENLQARINEGNAIAQSCESTIDKLLPQLRELVTAEDFTRIQALDARGTTEYYGKLESQLLPLESERDAFETGYAESVKKAAATKTQYDTTINERLELEEQLEAISRYLTGKGEQPRIECDKCGSILTPEQWAKHTDEIKSRNEATESKIKQLEEQWSKETQASETLLGKSKDAKTSIESIEKTLVILRQLAPQREDQQKADIARKQAQEEQTQTQAELRRLLSEDEKPSNEQIIQMSLQVQPSLESIPKQIEDLQRELKSYEENVSAPQLKRVEEARLAGKQVQELQPQIDLDIKKIEMLQTIRTAFREIQPAVRKSFVSKITASANDYLKRLYGGAELQNFEFTEDYEFIVTRAGHKRHAYRLSGGQQVLASMAFMLALSEVLSQLDFLILDEPTTHLDENRRKELVNVLENLRRVPQLIVVDHHSELLIAADEKFRIDLNEEGQSKVSEISDQLNSSTP